MGGKHFPEEFQEGWVRRHIRPLSVVAAGAVLLGGTCEAYSQLTDGGHPTAVSAPDQQRPDTTTPTLAILPSLDTTTTTGIQAPEPRTPDTVPSAPITPTVQVVEHTVVDPSTQKQLQDTQAELAAERQQEEDAKRQQEDLQRQIDAKNQADQDRQAKELAQKQRTDAYNQYCKDLNNAAVDETPSGGKQDFSLRMVPTSGWQDVGTRSEARDYYVSHPETYHTADKDCQAVNGQKIFVVDNYVDNQDVNPFLNDSRYSDYMANKPA